MKSFKAATWNIYHDTPVEDLRPILRRQRNKGVSLLLAQEAGGRDIRNMFRDEGLQVHLFRPQFLIAFDPESWVAAVLNGVRLSPTPWYNAGGNDPRYADMATAILCDDEGQSLLAGSYHLAPHTQFPEDAQPDNRIKSTVESFQTMGALAERSKTHGVLFGGDDNLDERFGFGAGTDRWAFALSEATGLRQVRAPNPTLGNRRIDDFRVKKGGNLQVEDGWTFDGGGDHRGHGREFVWRVQAA